VFLYFSVLVKKQKQKT